MLPIVVPVILMIAAGGAVYAHKHKGLTPERKAAFEALLNDTKLTATQLRKAADAYEKEGLKAQATLLRKRANIKELPPEKKKAYSDGYRKAMASKDPVAVERVANAYAQEGHTGAAASLREYAKGLRKTA